MHGAAGVILVNDSPNHQRRSGRAGEVRHRRRVRQTPGIPFVQVKAARVADRWFADAGKNLEGIIALPSTRT